MKKLFAKTDDTVGSEKIIGPSLLAEISQLIDRITACLIRFIRSVFMIVSELAYVCFPFWSLEMIKLSGPHSDQQPSQPPLCLLVWSSENSLFEPYILWSATQGRDISSGLLGWRIWQSLIAWVIIITDGPWNSQKWQRATSPAIIDNLLKMILFHHYCTWWHLHTGTCTAPSCWAGPVSLPTHYTHWTALLMASLIARPETNEW